VRIDTAAYQAMLAHLQQAVPNEGCGLLAGLRKPPCPQDTDGDGNCGRRHCPYCGDPDPYLRLVWRVCDTWVPMDNVAEYPRHRFEMGPETLIATWRQLDDAGRRPWIIVHSHVTAGATPSVNDIRYAQDDSLLHLVVSLQGAEPFARLWRIRPDMPRVEQVQRIVFEVVDLGFQKNSPTDLTRGVSEV
jgi:proteasome lid subunit RPN8/RPN11